MTMLKPGTTQIKKSHALRPVTLHLREGEPITLTCGSGAFQRIAVGWSHSLRNRHRWLTDDSIPFRRKDIVDESRTVFPEFKNDRKFNSIVERLARAEIIEVTLPEFEDEKIDWSLRVFPWEFFLSSLTKEARVRRASEDFLVTRVLPVAVQAKNPARIVAPEESILMVGSTPEPLNSVYNYDSEAAMLCQSLGLENDSYLLDNPTRSELVKKIKHISPGILHLAGFDARNASRYIDEIEDEKNLDGYVLSGEAGKFEVLRARMLGEVLTSGKSKPSLVSFNISNSAARMCPLVLARNGNAAIGFQDELDKQLAEIFFGNFYQAWSQFADWKLLSAFAYAFRKTRELPKKRRMRGSGIVLWSTRSLLNDYEGVPELQKRRDIWANKEAELRIHTKPAESDKLEFNITPLKRLIYAILHNRGDLFEKFEVVRGSRHAPKEIVVEVLLRVGTQEYPYRAIHELEDASPSNDLNPYIRIPLSWDYLSTLNESVRTTVSVRISLPNNGKVLKEKTYALDLAPLEEWSDTPGDRDWLPSFIQPRDPAVSDAIGLSRLHLSTLTDDPNAGFDGYQSYGLNYNDPGEGVDTQVRAIWSALLLHYKLQYINPPPSYYDHAQRLRCPSEVIERKHGTCIDLSLLLASCLEYVEIHPVIFLMKGHAFPGYWRSEIHGEYFRQGKDTSGLPVPLQSSDCRDWVYDQSHRERIYDFIAEGHLVPLESTLLTQNEGFFAACDSGIEVLRDFHSFEFLLDICRARTEEDGATPLPIRIHTKS